MYLRHIAAVLAAVLLLTVTAPAEPAEAAEPSFTELSNDAKFTAAHADVFRLYWAALGREPEAGGAAYWASEVDRCVGIQDIAAYFVASPEFQLTYGELTDEGFINLIYANVLERARDIDGFNYWLGTLTSGQLDRSGVLLYFSLAEEFRAKHPLPSDARPNNPCGVSVKRIIDGDSVELSNGTQVRIIGIDAPEYGTCWANESKARMAALLAVGSRPVLVSDTPTTDNVDRYARLLRFIEVGGVDIGRQMIAEGFAEAYPYDGGSTRAVSYEAAERSAKAASLGIWNASNGCYGTGGGTAPLPAAGCHPHYSSPCLPIGPDLDCGDIRQVVILVDPRYDEYGLDGAYTVGNGIGCESYA